MAQDSSRPEFWDTRFRDGVTPWDAGGVPPLLPEWVQTKTKHLRVLVPGAGTGYEVRLFAERGHDVLAIDFSDAALEAARRELGVLADRVRKADFFTLSEGSFDLVYELAGFFYLDDNERGPPFGVTREELKRLLGSAFELLQDRPVPPAQSLPVFKGKEIWQVWKRRL